MREELRLTGHLQTPYPIRSIYDRNHNGDRITKLQNTNFQRCPSGPGPEMVYLNGTFDKACHCIRFTSDSSSALDSCEDLCCLKFASLEVRTTHR
ncbi:hypothetical protein F2P81_009041 [Scophthalmus maximus]|uniref:Uncharacterized protein n=1 Tax=Scophthalmus maximus TaxID=52904 RepID=A0A6A4SY69_SCOMX|nr:hypothetical protein F2P81_009041 [Scophthalmus maximus]